MSLKAQLQGVAAILAALSLSTAAHAAADPTGIWFDHDERGAVEIRGCEDGKGLCGYVVYVRDQRHAGRCGLQILGHVSPGGGGWIYSPERGRKYDVALTRLSDDKLRVVGNAGSRFFSRTFTWKRAPDDIARCGETAAAAPAPALGAPIKAVADAPAAEKPAKRQVETQVERASAKVPATTPESLPEARAAKRSNATTRAASLSSVAPMLAKRPQENGARGTCSYRIPYVGRTISIRCRN